MKLIRSEILNAIGKVKPALLDGKLIEFAGLLLFDGKKLISYGDEISISVPLETDFIAAVKAEEFSQLIQKIKENEVDLEIEEGQLLVKAGKMKAGFTLVEYDPESVPDLGLSQVEKWNKFPEGFVDALKFCMFSASSSPEYGVLCSLKIEPERIISSDNYRISEKLLSKKMKGIKEQLLMPRKVASFLANFKLEKFAITEACAHYRDEAKVVFTHRLISDEYPDVDAFLKVEGNDLQLPKDISGALDAASTIAETVDISVEKGLIRVRGESENRWIEYPVDSDYDGEKLVFRTSPEHMIQILRYSQQVTVGENILLFTSENFRHSVCLISDDE